MDNSTNKSDLIGEQAIVLPPTNGLNGSILGNTSSGVPPVQVPPGSVPPASNSNRSKKRNAIIIASMLIFVSLIFAITVLLRSTTINTKNEASGSGANRPSCSGQWQLSGNYVESFSITVPKNSTVMLADYDNDPKCKEDGGDGKGKWPNCNLEKGHSFTIDGQTLEVPKQHPDQDDKWWTTTVTATTISYSRNEDSGGANVCIINSPTKTPTVTPTKTPSPTPTKTPTVTPTKTPSPTPTKTPTVTPTKTPSPTPTKTPTVTPTKTPSPTPTKTPTNTPTPTRTPTPLPISCSNCSLSKPYLCTSNTNSSSQMCNSSGSASGYSCVNCYPPTPTNTPTATPTPTNSPTPVPSATFTPMPSSTHTPTPSMCPKPAAVTNIRISCPLCK